MRVQGQSLAHERISGQGEPTGVWERAKVRKGGHDYENGQWLRQQEGIILEGFVVGQP